MTNTKNRVFSLNVPAELHKDIKICAARQEIQIKELIQRAVREYLEKHLSEQGVPWRGEVN